jgi:hypothetical protein
MALVNEQSSLQLTCLFTILGAINETCKGITGSEFSSGEGPSNGSDSPSSGPPSAGGGRGPTFPVFLNKLAQICDSKKGGDTVTALICLVGSSGGSPDYVLCSNNRSDPELDEVTAFLSDLLTFIFTNPQGLNEKPLHRQVLWRILEFNFARVSRYVGSLAKEIGNCIKYESKLGEGGGEFNISMILAVCIILYRNIYMEICMIQV